MVFGCVDTIGPQAGDIARTCWLAAGLPEEVPGVTIDRQCGSSQQAVHFAAQAVMSGTADLVVAGGVQNMSMIPIASAMTAGRAARLRRPVRRLGGLARAATATQEVCQFRGAEMIAEKWDITRDDMEAFALESATGAPLRAHARGPLRRPRSRRSAGSTADEGPRATPNLEKMAALKPLRRGRPAHRRAVAARSPTAPAALLIASRAGGEGPRADAARAHPPPQRARRRPGLMLTAPIPATAHALEEGRA